MPIHCTWGSKKTASKKEFLFLQKLRLQDSCLVSLEYTRKHLELSSHNPTPQPMFGQEYSTGCFLEYIELQRPGGCKDQQL